MSLLDYLESHNFVSSKVLKNVEGQAISKWQDKPVMVKVFIEGAVLDSFTDEILTYLGGELAKLHQLEAPHYLPKTTAYGIDRFDEVKTYAAELSFMAG